VKKMKCKYKGKCRSEDTIKCLICVNNEKNNRKEYYKKMEKKIGEKITEHIMNGQ